MRMSALSTPKETAARPSVEQLWCWLAEVPDPEIPAISVVDLGIVRDVAWLGADGAECLVTITPTYSGCPATEIIREQIGDVLRSHGIERIRMQVQLSPAWTTDWMTPQGRDKLRSYGIAPPVGCVSEHVVDVSRLVRPTAEPTVACPNCGSTSTEMVSRFGSTPCKSLYRCKACLEPFDYFKRH
jgi:ring-1,2-phenylacetyl-CoA epoxidase subunit PaaD